MGAPSFTPGPWAVVTCNQGEGCWCRIITTEATKDDDSLEGCIIPSGAVHKRDARLIAAAPELYEALEHARAAIDSLDEDELGRHPELGHFYRDELLHNIDAALSRARDGGGQ